MYDHSRSYETLRANKMLIKNSSSSRAGAKAQWLRSQSPEFLPSTHTAVPSICKDICSPLLACRSAYTQSTHTSKQPPAQRKPKQTHNLNPGLGMSLRGHVLAQHLKEALAPSLALERKSQAGWKN